MPRARVCALLIVLVLGSTSYATTRADELKARADDGNLGLAFKSSMPRRTAWSFITSKEAKDKIVASHPRLAWYLWPKVMLELGKDYRVIAVDTRGMGDSERPESGYDAETAANDLSD